ncbi:hypothetical protein LCGC14_0702760 [marine sediment metagenome]|uniref:Uncharacterized protein n=1 Tax=marine sediment metagenome TaxID=412755 RepID=A0A0F9QHC1_9ZZZZ
MSWLTPRDWQQHDVIAATRLNDISTDLNYLFNRPRDETLYEIPVSITMTNTTPVAIDTANFRVSLETFGGDVLIGYSLISSHGTAAGVAIYDILMDNDIYASSKNTVYAARGIYYRKAQDNADQEHITQVFLWTDISAGTHYFDLMAWVVSGTLTLDADSTIQLWALEV